MTTVSTRPAAMTLRIEGNPVTRSEAKRLMQCAAQFRCVLLDFAEVGSIGQAFADEIFRVFANAHSDVELIATHAVPEVQQMIRRAEALRDEQSGPMVVAMSRTEPI